MRRFSLRPVLAAVLITVFASSARAAVATASASESDACDANACYYMAIFSSQVPLPAGQEPDLLDMSKSHSFARFMKWSFDGAAEVVDINWIPPASHLSGEVDLFDSPTVEGENQDIFSALDTAQRLGRAVSIWGPYAIRPELYGRALNQRDRLLRHDIAYDAIDLLQRHSPLGASRAPADRKALNCFHAISDIDTVSSGYLKTYTANGEAASRLVAQHLKRWIVGPAQFQVNAAWRMGLYQHPLFQWRLITDRSADLAAPVPALSYDPVYSWENMPTD